MPLPPLLDDALTSFDELYERLRRAYGQRVMYGTIAVLVPLCFILGVVAVTEGQALLMATAISTSSLVAGWFIRRFIEEVSTEGMFDLASKSLTFIVGDTLVLTVAMIATVRGWQSAELSASFMGWRWLLASLLVGLAVASWFRYIDAGRYYRDYCDAALRSPTSVWRGLGYSPVLIGLFVWAGVPQLVDDRSFDIIFAAYLIVIWFGLVAWDRWVRKLSPKAQYPRWSSRRFKAYRLSSRF